MGLFDWIVNYVSAAVSQGVKKGLNECGIDPDADKEGNPLAAAKAHQVSSGNDLDAKPVRKAKSQQQPRSST